MVRVSDYAQTQYEQSVYAVYEVSKEGDDRLRHIFEDDGDAVGAMIDYYEHLAELDSVLLTGEFHAADGGDTMEVGDYYLTKCHGVSISEGLYIGGSDE